jgi:hypothetical protein
MERKWAERVAAGSLLLLPAAAAAGWAAGALSARRWLRREMANGGHKPADREHAVPQAAARELHAPGAAAPEPPAPEDLDEETLTVISAAVAAFLGKPARIRHARLIGQAPASTAWAQQGRAYVQASHNLPARLRA